MADALSAPAAIGSTRERSTDLDTEAQGGRRPTDLLSVQLFLILFAGLLAGYMFMGRGFAHLGVPPFYVGEVVLFAGLIVTIIAFIRLKLRVRLSPIVWLLLALMVWGLARTVPYLGVYATDALRDAVLWGYATFALIIYVLVDRRLVLRAMRVYGGVVPIFAVWLPICFNLFLVLGASIDPNELGSDIPLIFFKSGDMSVHVVGSIAFLVLGLGAWGSARSFLWRSAIVVPLLWTAFIAGATNRGGLVSVLIGLTVVAILAFLLRRARNWYPVLGAVGVLAVILATPGLSLSSFTASPTTSPTTTPSTTRSTGTSVSSATSAPSASTRAPESAPPTSESSARPTSTTAPGFSAASLAPNSGFELGAINSGTIDGWVTATGSYNIVGGGGYGGENFASVHATGEPHSAFLTSTEFPFRSEDDISVSVRVKAMSGSPVLEIHVHWYDRSGAHLGTALAGSVVTGGDTAWQEGSGILTPPANTTQARIFLVEATGGGAMVGIDEVVVAAVRPGFSAASLAPNSGFELGAINSGTIDGWVTATGSYNIVGGGGYAGENLASVHATGEPRSAWMTSTEFPFRSEDEISVSVRAKAVSGSPVLEIHVHWYDGSGAHLGTALAGSVVTGGDTAWREGSGILIPPANTTHARIFLVETTGGGATVGIDEVVVESGDFLVRPPPPPAPEGRPATIAQIIENIGSVFASSPDEGLEGTRRFRLRWWGAIVNYTVFGDYFWSGKGFGVNLADDDGFQATGDGSLRAPHNSHITALARMGVPGFTLWVLVQGAFGIGLLRSVLAHRRAGDLRIAALGGWLLAYWTAMMVNTSFDPYIEGPQGGIWFWAIFGLGMVVMRLTPRPPET